MLLLSKGSQPFIRWYWWARNLSGWTGTSEENGAEDDDLQKTLHDDVLPHLGSEQVLEAWVGFALQQLIGGRLGGQRQGGQIIQDEVDPHHLDGQERRLI